MQLLTPHTNLRFQKHQRQYVFADELVVKIQRFRECFLGSPLPFPTSKVITAWNDLPNVTMDNLAMSVRTGLAFLRAPPPTPTGFAFAKDGPTSGDLSSNDSHDDDGWLVIDDTTLSTLDIVVPRNFEGSATSEDDSMSRYSHADQPLDQQTNGEDLSQSPDNSSLSSDQESSSSSGAGSPMPVGFDNMVNQWLLDYRARGTDAFIESLIAFAAISVGTAIQASRIARSMIRKVAKVSYTEGKELESNIRLSVLTAFKKCWESNDTSTKVTSTRVSATPPTPHGINIASMMGGLFSEKISSAKDVHLCLSLLLEGEKRFDRLCAMHALLIQANDKLCKSRNFPVLMRFKDDLTCVNKESGEYLWATTPQSKVIITDILALIERWIVSQTNKREQSRVAFGTGNRTIRNRAVGPRLRNGTTCLAR